MSLKLYNTFTNKKEEFNPVTQGKVKIYSCGVTVYDECHIGHARSLYVFDIIRRYLKYKKYAVTFVRNITDIDDKIISKAKELGVDAKEISEKYIKSYYSDLAALGIEQADIEPKATDHIPEMVKHIQGLIDKEYAYAVEGDVYFRVKKFEQYGKLSGQSIDSMLESVRIESDSRKEDALDFALWKHSKPGEPEYDSPWSKGRPGWHMECSVMSRKYLGDTFDIHAGGRDLVFPHHENEIAQSEALTGKKFANYWLHHGLLTINEQKMAKSLGNFITIKDAIKQYTVDVLKIFYLQAHYSSPLNFTPEKMQECRSARERFYTFFDVMLKRKAEIKKVAKDLSQEFKQAIASLKQDFIEAMDDNFNTPIALGKLFEIMHETNVRFHNEKIDSNDIDFALDVVKELSTVLGLRLEHGESIPDDIKSMAEKRNKAREEKNFAQADDIRDKLLQLGYILEDVKDGKTICRKKH